MVEFVYNSAKHESIGKTPFEAEIRYNPSIYRPRRENKINNK